MRIQHISICSPVLELTRPSSSWVGDSSFPPAHIIYIYIERTPVPGRGFSPVNITINSAIPATETGFPAKENRHGQGYRLVHVHPDLCIPTHLRRPTRPRRVSASANWCWCLETHELVMGVNLTYPWPYSWRAMDMPRLPASFHPRRIALFYPSYWGL